MIIIVNVSEEYYEKIKEKSVFGKELLVETDFIHASKLPLSKYIP